MVKDFSLLPKMYEMSKLLFFSGFMYLRDWSVEVKKNE